ncbi:hypothetical protein CQA53_05820 [Helicobacter didelphidarum]|uniref:Uncharacterized protein n=1 Tax=Helicobacter didelphidarum TaxID=2040648 RepID=A0A3D8ILB6_9HELI|nr:hypothetical protein CQA53_05820 [Helicobacter didelphidarum]
MKHFTLKTLSNFKSLLIFFLETTLEYIIHGIIISCCISSFYNINALENDMRDSALEHFYS